MVRILKYGVVEYRNKQLADRIASEVILVRNTPIVLVNVIYGPTTDQIILVTFFQDYSLVEVKRPIGEATCRDRCGSKEPQTLTNGVCYCDIDCANHLDCCLDYADHCLPRATISCQGYCGTPTAQPIPGGGYCWCHEACNPHYTDNHSDGSCCPDYHEQCQGRPMPACLDGRTQASALGLFLAHVSVSRLYVPVGQSTSNKI